MEKRTENNNKFFITIGVVLVAIVSYLFLFLSSKKKVKTTITVTQGSVSRPDKPILEKDEIIGTEYFKDRLRNGFLKGRLSMEELDQKRFTPEIIGKRLNQIGKAIIGHELLSATDYEIDWKEGNLSTGHQIVNDEYVVLNGVTSEDVDKVDEINQDQYNKLYQKRIRQVNLLRPLDDMRDNIDLRILLDFPKDIFNSLEIKNPEYLGRGKYSEEVIQDVKEILGIFVYAYLEEWSADYVTLGQLSKENNLEKYDYCFFLKVNEKFYEVGVRLNGDQTRVKNLKIY